MNLIDTHAHLTWDSFKDDLDQVVKRAIDSGLKTIINVGADLESSQEAVELESPNPEISFYSSIGLHPHEASKLLTSESLPTHSSLSDEAQTSESKTGRQGIHENINKLEDLYHQHSDKIVAVGECGLDYYFQGVDFTPSTLSLKQLITLQKELFLAQISLAKKLNLPLIIHCRDSWKDIFVPELEGTKGVFHSFTGSKENAQQALGLGYYLGFSCPITYPKNEILREIIKTTPLDKILTETDCPFLPPQTMRGQRNEPANISEVIKVITEVKGLPEKEISQAVYQNTFTLFPLP